MAQTGDATNDIEDVRFPIVAWSPAPGHRTGIRGTMVVDVIVEPDVAVFDGPTRYARQEASARTRVLLVLAWALALVAVVELPLWVFASGVEADVAQVNHHVILADGGSFVARGHPVESFVGGAELRDLYARLDAARGGRVLALLLLGCLSGAGIQLVLARLGRHLRRRGTGL